MSTKNFSEKEFACKCCGQVKVSQELLDKLQIIRDEINLPITVTSGYRCEKHNKAVGGKENSQHLKGNAADITCSDLEKLYSLCASHFQAVGDGRRKGFVHVDLRPELKRWIY